MKSCICIDESEWCVDTLNTSNAIKRYVWILHLLRKIDKFTICDVLHGNQSFLQPLHFTCICSMFMCTPRQFYVQNNRKGLVCHLLPQYIAPWSTKTRRYALRATSHIHTAVWFLFMDSIDRRAKYKSHRIYTYMHMTIAPLEF